MVSRVGTLEELSDSARIWIFPLTAPLPKEKEAPLRDQLEKFVSQWTSHKAEVSGAFSLFKNKFIIIAAESDVSGCSIDSVFRAVKTATSALNIELADISQVFFQKEGRIVNESRSDFEKRCQNNQIVDDTIVYDPAIGTLNDFRSGRFELPFSKSWHQAAFSLGTLN